MNDKTQAILEQLAHQLGTTVPYLWTVLVRQARIEAIVNITTCITIAGILFISSRWLFNKSKNMDKTRDYRDDSEIPYAFGCATFVLSIGVAAIGILINIAGILFPQGEAIKYLLQVVK